MPSSLRSTLIAGIAVAVALAVSGCSGTAPQRPATDAQLLELRDLLVGELDSRDQARRDADFYAISLKTIEIWPQRDDGPWLYVEQAALDSLDKPYRQRVYRLQRDAGQLLSRVYLLPGDPLRFAGADGSAFDQLSPEQLEERQGCAVRLSDDGEGGFSGATEGQACTSDLRGASYATSEVSLSLAGIDSWDRGYDAAGKQVWGAVKGPYQFRRRAAVMGADSQ